MRQFLGKPVLRPIIFLKWSLLRKFCLLVGIMFTLSVCKSKFLALFEFRDDLLSLKMRFGA